jgi:hypothetical protein
MKFAQERYARAAHAMQSGVSYDLGETVEQPKHIRVGINAALVDSSALATLMIGKGLITLPEYYEALADAMEREQRRYEELLTKKMGVPVTLA